VGFCKGGVPGLGVKKGLEIGFFAIMGGQKGPS